MSLSLGTCEYCGRQNETTAQFCSDCGKPLTKAAAARAAVAAGGGGGGGGGMVSRTTGPRCPGGPRRRRGRRGGGGEYRLPNQRAAVARCRAGGYVLSPVRIRGDLPWWRWRSRPAIQSR